GYGGGYGMNRYNAGGYGGGYGMNRYGAGAGGYGGPEGMMGPGEMPLSARMEQSTQATFQTLDQIVQAFGGLAQMLESTFHATHSSFMAMVGVAEQMGSLRAYLGRAFSVVAAYTAIRNAAMRLVGRTPPADPATISTEGFADFEARRSTSRKPLWMFLFLTVGLPWLMSRLFRRVQQRTLEDAAAAAASPAAAAGAPGAAPPLLGPDGRPLHPSQIRDLEFCRAVYDFTAESPAELSLRRGDIVAILSKLDPATGAEGSWWRGRLQSGPVGLFPSNYVEIIEKK
ncbi:Peroxin 13, N-terminal region-domain-containing protein, partial [Blyttiomyces helicus]